MPNFCRQCGRPINPAARFCPGCGLDTYQQSVIDPQSTSPQAYQKKSIDHRKNRKRLTLAVIAVVTVVCIVAGILFLPPIIQAYRLEKYINDAPNETYTADIPVSDQPAFEVTPAAGITISGEANALDKKRQFKAKMMTDQELFDYSETHASDESLHLAGFTLDASMKPGERFDQPVTLTLELDKLGIPEAVFNTEKLVLLHVREDGIEEEIPCEVNGGVMTARILSNNIFIIKGVSVGYAAIHGILVARKFFNVVLNTGTVFRYYYLGNTYKIYWPAALPPSNPVEVNAVEQRLIAVYQSCGIDMSEGLARGINALANKQSGGREEDVVHYKRLLIEKICADPEYQSCMKILDDPTWIRQNVLPAKVAVMVDCLELAEDYLFEGNRGFRRPGHVIDVLVAGDGGIDWPEQHGRDSLGAAVNELSLSPYLHLNAKQLIIDAPGESGRQQAVISTDNMLLTTVHELFHIIQSGYVAVDYKSRRWFSEATAVTLEMEAYDYFSSTGWIESSKETISFTPRNDYYMGYLSSYANQPYWASGEHNFDDYDMHYGYAAADFLEFIRDNHYSGFRNNFLPDLMIRYSYSSDVSGSTALINTLGGAPANLSKAYRAFIGQPNDKIYRSMYINAVEGKGLYAALFKNLTGTMNSSKPDLEIKTRYLPLSLTPHPVNITLPADRKAVLIAQTGSDAMQQSDWIRLSASFGADVTNRKTADRTGYTHLGELNQSGTVVFYEECSNPSMPSGGLNALGGSFHLLLLVQPEQPVVEFKEEKIIMDIPGKTALIKEGHVKQIQYTVLEPDGTAHQYRAPVEKSKMVIDYQDVNFDTTEPGATFKFFYTELIPKDGDGSQFIAGPDGVPAEYSINMPTGVFEGAAEWSTTTEEGDQYVYFADLIEPFYVYVKVIDDNTLRISAGKDESDAASRAQVCVYDDEHSLYKFYDWVDGRYACYEFTFSQDLTGQNIVEGYIIYYEKEEHVNSIFAPLESYKIIATEINH